MPSATSADLDSEALAYWDRMSGLSKIEREEFDAILNPADDGPRKYVDAWRHLHPDAEEFTLVTVHRHC